MIFSKQMVPRKQAFTLIELLTVIAIVGILTAILIPTVGRVQETARRTVDQSNIRQIGQSALIYANDYDGRLPGTSRTPIGTEGEVDLATGVVAEAVGIKLFAAALARNGGMNEASLWVSRSDPAAQENPLLSAVVDAATAAAPGRLINATFALDSTIVSYMGVSGLSTSLPASTPVVFTRGLTETGSWALADAGDVGDGVYGTDGGYIAFLGGNVGFYSDITANPLTDTNGMPTVNILETIPLTAGITTYAGAPLTAESGVAPP